jgi:hypothetical protein
MFSSGGLFCFKIRQMARHQFFDDQPKYFQLAAADGGAPPSSMKMKSSDWICPIALPLATNPPPVAHCEQSGCAAVER